MLVNDKMQQNYEYFYSAPEGENFAPDFVPDLTPKQMLQLGVFEGHYLNDCQKEFPAHWFEKAKLSLPFANEKANYFKLKSRMSLTEWRRRGWILGPDVRGWFQWYCRYYMGRRLVEIDRQQINRWKAFRRHYAQVRKNCLIMDFECRKRQRQALLQWAYNPLF